LSLNSYSSALVPSLLGNGLTLLPLSPAFGKGIDPSTLSGLSANLVSDLKKYIYTDINGKTRPQGGVDLEPINTRLRSERLRAVGTASIQTGGARPKPGTARFSFLPHEKTRM